jgi:hypothetical protein
MLQTLAGMFIAFFCVAGAVSIIRYIALRITAPCYDDSRVYAVMLKGKDADMELQMAMETLDWDNALLNARAYAIDCGLDKDTAILCKEKCENSRFRFVSCQEFGDVIQTSFEEK